MPRKAPIHHVQPVMIPPVYRPPPPRYFTAAERAIWEDSVSGMRDSWFCQASLPLLRNYCTIAARADAIANEARDLPVNSPESRALSAEHLELAKMVALLATKLRLAPSSNKSTKDGTNRQRYPKPWEGLVGDGNGEDDHADAS